MSMIQDNNPGEALPRKPASPQATPFGPGGDRPIGLRRVITALLILLALTGIWMVTSSILSAVGIRLPAPAQAQCQTPCETPANPAPTTAACEPPTPQPVRVEAQTTASADPRSMPPASPSPHAGVQVVSASYKLNGIIHGPDGITAIINGKPIRTGQEIDGARLLSATGKSVVLDVAGRKLTLEF